MRRNLQPNGAAAISKACFDLLADLTGEPQPVVGPWPLRLRRAQPGQRVAAAACRLADVAHHRARLVPNGHGGRCAPADIGRRFRGRGHGDKECHAVTGQPVRRGGVSGKVAQSGQVTGEGKPPWRPRAGAATGHHLGCWRNTCRSV